MAQTKLCISVGCWNSTTWKTKKEKEPSRTFYPHVISADLDDVQGTLVLKILNIWVLILKL